MAPIAIRPSTSTTAGTILVRAGGISVQGRIDLPATRFSRRTATRRRDALFLRR
jgi:hypothetical protein